MKELAPAITESTVTGFELNLRNTVLVLRHDKNLESGVRIQTSHPLLFGMTRSKNNVLTMTRRRPALFSLVTFPASSNVSAQLEISVPEYFTGGLKLRTDENTQLNIDYWIGGTLDLDMRRGGHASFGLLDDVDTSIVLRDRSSTNVAQWNSPFNTRMKLSTKSVLDVNRFQAPRFSFDVDLDAGCIARFQKVSNVTPCRMNITGSGTLEIQTVVNGALVAVNCTSGQYSLFDPHKAIRFDTAESEQYVDRSTGDVRVPPLLAQSRLCLLCKDNGNYIQLSDARSWRNRHVTKDNGVRPLPKPEAEQSKHGEWRFRPW